MGRKFKPCDEILETLDQTREGINDLLGLLDRTRNAEFRAAVAKQLGDLAKRTDSELRAVHDGLVVALEMVAAEVIRRAPPEVRR